MADRTIERFRVPSTPENDSEKEIWDYVLEKLHNISYYDQITIKSIVSEMILLMKSSTELKEPIPEKKVYALLAKILILGDDRRLVEGIVMGKLNIEELEK
jgi:hypothetical protein